MQIGEWRVDTIAAGRFWLDGGAVFGVVPKTVWQTVIAADAQNRVQLGMTCLLVRNANHTVRVDTAHGDKLSPLDRKAHGLEDGAPLLTRLSDLGVEAEQVDHVVFSHLHWDHSGGATTYDASKQLVPTFTKATYHVHRLEWEDAMDSDAPLGGFDQRDYLPLANIDRLRFTESHQTIVPGLAVIHTGGHTRGHQVVLFESGGQGVLYLGDICPTVNHIHRLWCTAYDVELHRTRREKAALLGLAADRGYWIVFNHGTETVVSRIEQQAKRGFVITNPQPGL